MVDTLLLISLLIGGVLACIGSVVGGQYFKYLRKNYPDIWENLGRPGFVFDSTLQSRRALEAFGRNKDYLKFADAELVKRSIVFRQINRAINFFCIVFILLMISHFLSFLL